MIYFTCENDLNVQGHIGDEIFLLRVRELHHYTNVTEVQADGDELVRCCDILGRTTSKRVYTFLGNNAQEIARNW